MMEDKRIDVLSDFMENLDVKGICGFWIDVEEDIHGYIWVYIILDLDWIQEIPTKPEFIARRMREGVKEEIKKWLGMDVMVGSTAKKCDK
jgi:hypothetical protein